MTKYNIKYLTKKGFNFKEYLVENHKIYIDTNNSISYVEVKGCEDNNNNNNNNEETIRKIIEKYPKIKYIWIYYQDNSLKVYRKAEEIKRFTYYEDIDIERKNILKGKLKKFSPKNMDVLFDTIDIKNLIMNRFYNQLWEHRLKMANSITLQLEDRDKLFIVQHFMDRLIFFYFLAQLNIIVVKCINNGKVMKTTLNKKETRIFFKYLIEHFSDKDIQKLLNTVFFKGLGGDNKNNKIKNNNKNNGNNKNRYITIQITIKGHEFEISVPYLNGGLYNEREFKCNNGTKIKESLIEFEGIKNLIETLNQYNWIVGDYAEEDDEDIEVRCYSLTPEIIGHVYEKFVVGLENIRDIELDKIKIDRGVKIGRKKIGAFYTPEEITKYISNNTIIPYLFNRLEVGNKYRDFNEFTEKAPINLLKKALDILDNIKILDPASGSGHFLISAGKLLFSMKNKICKKLEENDNSFNRGYDAYDEVKTIIMNNLYGVDICNSAVEISKLRLWLWLISQLKNTSPEFSELKPLPNLEYTIKYGNALIGWINENIGNISIDMNEKNKMKLKEIFRELDLSSTKREDIKILKNVEKLLYSYKIGEYIEAFCLIYSIYQKDCDILDTVKLNNILEIIRKSIYDTINPIFLNYINQNIKDKTKKINDREFNNLNPFHWGVDFGWIIKNGGFDIIVGNPPYGNILSNVEKRILRVNNRNIAIDFIERSMNLINISGNVGLIVPHSISRASTYLKIREHMYKNKILWKIVDAGNPFKGVTLEMVILFLNKHNNKCVELTSFKNNFYNIVEYKKAFIKDKYYRILIYRDELYEYINSQEVIFPFSGFRGHDISVNLDIISKKPFKESLWFMRGKNINKFRTTSIENYDRYIPKKYAKKEFIFEEAIVITQFGINLKATKIYGDNHYPSGGLIIINSDLEPELSLMILNSDFINKYLQRYIFNCAELTVHLDGIYLKEIPVPKIPDEIKNQYINAGKMIEIIVKKGFVKEGLILNEALIIDLYIYKEFKLVKNLMQHFDIQNMGANYIDIRCISILNDMIHNAELILKRFKEDWGAKWLK